MADEDITLDGKPLQSLRVADLKAALEQRNLPKSGQKNTLLKRLKGALMLENLQKSSSSHTGLQPNSQIGEEMSQNSFIKQYLAKQQELLRQRLEREAQQEEEAEESPAVVEEDEDHSEDNDCYVSDKKHHNIPPKSSMTRAEEKEGGESMMGHMMMACGPDVGPAPILHPQESIEAPGVRMQRATFHQGHKEPPAPSPPRAVASLSVRVLGQPDRQGLPPAVPRAQEKEGTAPSEPGSAHPVLHLSRSAGVSAGGQVHEDSDDDDDDESEDDEDWGPGPGGARKGNQVPPQPQQMPPSAPSTVARSKRKLQPPQHIPPPQVHHTPMQLRHPTPPPSPPPDLFPLPDTPKQSPPDTDDQEGDGPEASCGPRLPPSTMQRQDSDSSSRSSSPEPPIKRRPGPLSLLVHKMESEGAFRAAESASAVAMSGEASHSTAGSTSSSESSQNLERKRLLENRAVEEERRLNEEKEQHQKQERERKKIQEQDREKKRLEEEKERKQLEEEEKQRQKEEREKERNRQQEEKERKHQQEEKERKHQQEEKERKHQQEEKEKERKHQDEEKRREEKMQKEKRQETANKGRVVVTEAQDSGSSSDSDSKSDSSSHSSQSSSSSCGDKIIPVKKLKTEHDAEDEKNLKGADKRCLSEREVSEPSAAAVTEAEPDSESSNAQQPPSGAEPENSEGRLEESTTPKAFAARKISLTSSKTSPVATDGGAGDADAATAAGRKRRWGSSTAVTKKPSISITTDSLKSLIPDIKVTQEAVMELHPEELQMSGDEENLDTSGRGDQDKGLKIRRTVTQVVPGDSQENGQTNEEEEVEKTEKEKPRRPSRETRKNSVSEEALETQTTVQLEGEAKKVTPSDSLVRRSISQQKSGVSVTIDDPVRAARQPSPPHGQVSNIIHVTNLVRPFTLGQLKELLNRTGSVVEEGFWIDKIKSHCYVTYTSTEEAVATRAALHGVKWPSSNPKVLSVDFCEQDELDIQKGILKPEKEEELISPPSGPPIRLPPLMPERGRDMEHDRERDRGVAGVRDLWAERQREMERRERARGEREWDRDKVREFARPGEDEQRSRSRDRERRRRERAKSKERKTDKKEKGDEPPAKLLDDLFLKTKAAPCIYWLPLSEEQAVQRLLDRTERQKERERRRKEQQEEEEKKREEERKERLRGREKDGREKDGGVAVAAAASAGAAGRGADRDRERERGRDREGDKKRDNVQRPSRPSAGAAGSGRRSRSRSNPRDRRR
ncbi:apoptotic chromatin condensation inducer 1b isoform X3 [Clinocottus analis]|uniref:apoptotic chromatin condensation inducer 1b isoform X3 n=1 Tax=Clinocottus analis TaxID=304258 RepID=UPI0035C01457